MSAISSEISAARTQEGKINMHLPSAEQPILAELFKFRHSLSALRKESHDALTLADINAKATELSTIMKKLRDVRFADSHDIDLNEPRNRLDDVLDQVWMSMFYVWGKIAAIHESIYPTYVSLVTLSRTVDALRASKAWVPADVEPLQERLRILDEQVAATEGKFVAPAADALGDKVPYGQAVLTTLLNKIHRTVAFLNAENEAVYTDSELLPLRTELEGVNKQLTDLLATGYTLESLAPISKKLHHLDSTRGPTGKFHGLEAELGQATLVGMLNQAFDKLNLLVADLDPVTQTSPLFETYRALLDIHSELSRLLANTAVRSDPKALSAALVPIQERLAVLEKVRVEGTFVPSGDNFDHAVKLPGQASLHKLLHDCHSQISHLVEPISRPIGETLIPTYELLLKQRTTLRKLRAWASSGWNVREDLAKVEAVLKTVESSKVKGLFVGINAPVADSAAAAEHELGAPVIAHSETSLHSFATHEIPDGQSTVSALVDECDSLVWTIYCHLV
ncbi:UNVERIFIED_CONTAM: hypothetical protein HDU68_006659 [Siphonaria sp. JEL0065]|nr:hypothetical protein HDU68_006659 [Siphonaria sp. JEL0065]